MARSTPAAVREIQLHLLKGDVQQARELAKALLTRFPTRADAQHVSGIVHVCLGDAAVAIRLLESALRQRPALPAWMNDLAVAYAAAGRWSSAARVFSAAARIDKHRENYLVNAAGALLCAGKYREAVSASERAMAQFGISPAPLRTFVHGSLAVHEFDSTLKRLHDIRDQGNADASVDEFLAQCYSRLRRYDDALQHARAYARHATDQDRAQLLLGTALWDAGQAVQAARIFRRESRRNAENAEAHSAFINALLHHPEHTAGQLKREAERWADKFAGKKVSRCFPNAAKPDKVLRIGYLTGEFATVPAYFFLYPIISHHDHRTFHITCYHARASSDQRTEGIKQVSHRWRDVFGMSDDKLERLIRRDGIDILVDCSGHYAYGRLPLFALKPAPIQVAMPNCPATTGVPQIDYTLSDSWTSPPGSDGEYTEQVWRLRTGYMVYAPPSNAPGITPLPARRNGHLTYGIFQRPSKLNAKFWNVIASILSSVPDSHLLIHFSSADLDRPRSRTRERILRAFQQRGISRDRIHFRGYRPEFEHLQTIAECDIALDSFPYNGQTTTCECLWMGVPVVNLVGKSHVARVGQGILARVGMERGLSARADDYVACAVSFGADVSRLARIRRELRSRMQSSPLMDGAAATKAIEAAYREMWQRWCRGESAGPGQT